MQDDAERLSAGKNESVKKKNVNDLLTSSKKFRNCFNHLRSILKKFLVTVRVDLKFMICFYMERAVLPERLNIPLLIKSKEKTEYKRGLIQVLALNDWELKLFIRTTMNGLAAGLNHLKSYLWKVAWPRKSLMHGGNGLNY